MHVEILIPYRYVESNNPEEAMDIREGVSTKILDTPKNLVQFTGI